jgi:alanine or glycine:cation symporter, AGCS family
MYSIDLNAWVQKADAWLWGWPLLGFVMLVGIALTIALRFVQFKYFIASWKYVLKPPHDGKQTENYITPFQAFLNILSASIGNGSAAGMATAVVGGGPGAAFWIFVLGFLYMVIRYAEVYASLEYHEVTPGGAIRGGPMVYLKRIPGGTVLPYLYAFFCLGLSLITGNAMQCNSIRLGVERLTGIPAYGIAFVLFALLLYIMFGGASRIIRVSERIVPVKVGLFFIATLIVLIYHYQALWGALKLIVTSALTPQAVAGGIGGFSVQQAISFGMSRSLNATEAGLGTAGILYGSTKGQSPVINSIMSMSSSFISSHLVCFVLMVVLIATGVWDTGLVSTQLTMAAYETVFGKLGGGIVVAFLSITFGLGVLVAYAYIGRECWLYLTRGRFAFGYTILYCLMALFGSLSKVDLVWNATNIVNAGLVAINLYALLYLLPSMRAGLLSWEKGEKRREA